MSSVMKRYMINIIHIRISDSINSFHCLVIPTVDGRVKYFGIQALDLLTDYSSVPTQTFLLTKNQSFIRVIFFVFNSISYYV